MLPCEEEQTGVAQVQTKDVFQSNRAQEPFLIKAWRETRDAKSLSRLIDNYRPLFGNQIKKILAGRAINKEHRDDLQQECRLAFITAVESYDPTKNASLATHAQNHIRNALLQYSLDFRSSYRIGRGSDERKAYYAAQKLRARKADSGNGYINETEIEQIAKSTGASVKATRRAVETTQASQTTLDEEHDALTSGDHGEKYIASSARAHAMAEVKGFLAGISERNRQIITRSFLSDDDPSNVELSEDFEVSPERIGQIKKEVLKNLQEHLSEAGLEVEDIL